MEAIDQVILTLLLNSVWQAFTVTAVAALFDRLLHRKAARTRHVLWVVALITISLSPLLTFLQIASVDLYAALPPASTHDDFRAGENSVVEQAWLVPPPPLLLLAPFRLPVTLSQSTATALLGCYLLFLLCRSIRLLKEWRGVWTLRRSAREVNIPARSRAIVRDCQCVFGLENVTVLTSSSASGPLTLGCFRPTIILPRYLFRKSSENMLRAAVGHEMAHIRRQDFALNLLYELLTLPVSFNPAAALVKRRIELTRELACDEMVTERIMEARSYAQSIIDIASLMGPSMGRPVYTLGITIDADTLEERIMILIRKAGHTPSRMNRLLLFVLLLAVALPGASALAFSLQVNTDKSSAKVEAADSQEAKQSTRSRKQEEDDDDDDEDEAEEQAELAKQAKITGEQAQSIALSRAPGMILKSELERERGKVIYSFEIRTAEDTDKSVTEVEVNAENGQIINVEKEMKDKEEKD